MKTFFIFILILLSMLANDLEDCPRVIEGYKCEGKNCDHSEAKLQHAKKVMKLGGTS